MFYWWKRERGRETDRDRNSKQLLCAVMDFLPENFSCSHVDLEKVDDFICVEVRVEKVAQVCEDVFK